MATSAIPPAVLLVFLAAANLLAMTVWLMLGPLLVELAAVFHTSVAVTGQLTAATAITWGLTAFLSGPVSDRYGRRRMLLTGVMLTVLGTLGAVFAWNFGALLAFDAPDALVRRKRAMKAECVDVIVSADLHSRRARRE